MFKLVIQDDEGKTTVVPLIRDEITIGRKEGNTIRLTERNVSRRHARILRNNGEVHIEDLGSYNGIRVNNARIAERVSLRVSDQVQIGDYKLYLKAEGVEQVDDARTMPIERVESLASSKKTESLTAIPATTPTMPMGVPTTPAPATVPPAVSHPNRTQVATADTDPAGRPVATAAAVAALTTPVGYGKLVVLSSNFAGKEYELSRPQMIIGRTDENDIVINHRSISRNHAKLVREPETGRYTISDLQSSNGVRVNGQDYGKVELRRGDVVDLGHVRLRFVEPGEDFLFSRDAVITDVPDVGGKKTLLVAIILSVVVLGGIGAFFMMRSKPDDDNRGGGSGTAGDLGTTPGSQVAVVDPSDAMATATVPEPPDAAPLVGSNTPPEGPDRVKCLEAMSDRKWAKMIECTEQLKATDPDSAKELRAKANLEKQNEQAKLNLDDALKKNSFKTAKLELDKIAADSVYRQEAKTHYDSVTRPLADDYESRARAAAGRKECLEVARLQREADGKGLGEGARTIVCKDPLAVPKLDCNKTPNDPKCGDQVVVISKPDCTKTPNDPHCPKVDKPDCDADALKQKGQGDIQNGLNAAALAAFEASMKCKPDPSLLKLAFMAACNAKNATKAKLYYSKIPQTQQGGIAQMCIRNGITVP